MNAGDILKKLKNGEPVNWEEYPPGFRQVIEKRLEIELSTEEEE